MDTEEIEYLNELKLAHTRRLRQLKLKQAQQGYNCPPEVLTEIEEIEQQIAEIDQKLADPPVSPDQSISLSQLSKKRLLWVRSTLDKEYGFKDEYVQMSVEEVLIWHRNYEYDVNIKNLVKSRFFGKRIVVQGKIRSVLSCGAKIGVFLRNVYFSLSESDIRVHILKEGVEIIVYGEIYHVDKYLVDIKPNLIALID